MMAWRSDFLVFCMLMFFLVSTSSVVLGKPAVLNVKDYGAVADGKTDNSRAFLEAWEAACEQQGTSVITVPRGGKYYFSQSLTYWIKFGYVDYLTIAGLANLYGGGPSAWPYKGCGQGQECLQVVPHDLTLSDIRTTAPHDSPNTDGVHIAVSERVKILDSTFNTGDDCVAIFSGSKDVNISRSICGPGHGFSIGSMGKFPDEDPITKINIRNCTISHTDNGFRIKTWAVSSYPTFASDITVQDVMMDNVRNPIIIDQHYCPREVESQVQIKNLQIKRIWGTSTTETAVNLQCSSQKPCQGVELEDILLLFRNPEGGELQPAVSSCAYVVGSSRGKQVPKPCI
ncbi:Exopolygalacturonase clone GBGE184 [Vitis vinifera]|uniref:Exopolygalacturonase clone GBGE184 n=1 Tax=Vitis vinifera TaxID=29760 RepID=A0A438FDL6_VITVI|nr:Exopolygalacturonase clone GBGE184 [Vitis vinifera]